MKYARSIRFSSWSEYHAWRYRALRDRLIAHGVIVPAALPSFLVNKGAPLAGAGVSGLQGPDVARRINQVPPRYRHDDYVDKSMPAIMSAANVNGVP